MDRCRLPKISETLQQLGVEARRNRSRCPIHGGNNSQALSFDDEAGHWYCHRCAEGGDVVRLVERTLDTDFRGALCFFGLEPGRPPAPNPERTKQQQIRKGLQTWAERLGRQLRDEHYHRVRIEAYGLEKLRSNPEDGLAWSLLQIAYLGLGQLEELLDRVDISADADRLRAYREWRRCS